jgi:hypothetical protein
MGRGTGTAIEGNANREGMDQGRGMDRERGMGGEARGEPTSIAIETVDDPHRETGTRTTHHAVLDGGRRAQTSQKEPKADASISIGVAPAMTIMPMRDPVRRSTNRVETGGAAGREIEIAETERDGAGTLQHDRYIYSLENNGAWPCRSSLCRLLEKDSYGSTSDDI